MLKARKPNRSRCAPSRLIHDPIPICRLQFPNKLAEFLKKTQAKAFELAQMEENLIKVRKQAETQMAKAQAIEKTHGGDSSTREAQLQSELDKCMVSNSCTTLLPIADT